MVTHQRGRVYSFFRRKLTPSIIFGVFYIFFTVYFCGFNYAIQVRHHTSKFYEFVLCIGISCILVSPLIVGTL